jgi:hypothetical protein
MLKKSALSHEKEAHKGRHRQRRDANKAKLLDQQGKELKRLYKKLSKSPKTEEDKLKARRAAMKVHQFKQKMRIFAKESQKRRQEARSSMRKSAK